jgi:hypothetical protein
MNTTATPTLTSYEQHLADSRARRNADCAILREVATLGQAAGTWTIVKVYDEEGSDDRTPANAGAWRYVSVTTPEGTPFDLTVSRTNAGKIHASLGTLDNGPHRITASDLPYDLRNMKRPEANVALTRGAAAILKDITRRVIQHADALTLGAALRATLAQRQQSAQGLRAHMATLTAMGYEFHNVSATETYQAKGYKAGAPMLTVNAHGDISFDARVHIDNLAATLAAIGK